MWTGLNHPDRCYAPRVGSVRLVPHDWSMQSETFRAANAAVADPQRRNDSDRGTLVCPSEAITHIATDRNDTSNPT